MSEKKPPKRLVGWKQYVGNMVERILGRSAAGALLAAGLLSFGFFVFFLWVCGGRSQHPIGFAQRYLFGSGILAGLCLLGFPLGLWSAKVLLKRVEKIEPVGLLTRQNTGNLPEVETLVRSSDQPPNDQQAELLRAARNGAETSSGELRRATQGKGQE